MSTLTSSRVSTPIPTALPAALLLAGLGVVIALNGAIGGTLFFDGRDYSEVAGTPLHLVHYALWCAWLVAMSQILPRLGHLRGPDGSTFPRGLLVLAGVGAALDACARFVSAFVTPYLTAHEPALVDEAPDAVLLVPLLATGVVWMVGTMALAVVAWRRRILPRPAAVLFGLGGVGIPVIGPMATIPLGIGLAWAALHWASGRANAT